MVFYKNKTYPHLRVKWNDGKLNLFRVCNNQFSFDHQTRTLKRAGVKFIVEAETWMEV